MALKPLIGFGIGILLAGLLWKMYEDAITSFFSTYITDLTDEYYLLSDLLWNALPFILIFLGIVCLIFGSMIGNNIVSGGEK